MHTLAYLAQLVERVPHVQGLVLTAVAQVKKIS